MEKRTPCVTCARADQDKNDCSPICKRLVAFINGLDWRTEPIPTSEELGEAAIKEEAGRRKPEKGKTCEFPGCDSPHKSRGLCSRCHAKWLKGNLPGWPPYNVIMPQKRRKKTKAHSPAPKIITSSQRTTVRAGTAELTCPGSARGRPARA